MSHKYYDIVRGVQLPGEFSAITGRVHNWLYEKSDDIEPVSCWVLDVKDYDFFQFGKLFKDLGWKLQANAGVNICVEYLEEIIKKVKAINSKHGAGYVVVTGHANANATDIFECDPGRFYKVADSLRLQSQKSRDKFKEHISIFDTWYKTWESLALGETICFDFSDVQDYEDNRSSGTTSFINVVELIIKAFNEPTIYNFLNLFSNINATIRRGGFRKMGAVTVSCKSNASFINEYLDIPFQALPYVKKAVTLIKMPNFDLLSKLLEKYNKGEIFLEKTLGVNQHYTEIRSNVCRGIGLVSGDQCLISHVNMGMCREPEDIVKGFVETTKFVLDVYDLQQSLGYQNVDRQIAIGVVGLANYLRNNKITYPEFIDALVAWNEGLDIYSMESIKPVYRKIAQTIEALQRGFNICADMSRFKNMRACLTIEPTEACARRYKDLKGYAVAPNIDPPDVIPSIGIERRHSETGVKGFDGENIDNIFEYGVDICAASQLRYTYHFALWNEVQRMMNKTGLAHMSSYEHWSAPLNVQTFRDWWYSQLKTLYYYRQPEHKHLDKGNTLTDVRNRFIQKVDASEAICTDTFCESCSD